MKTKTFKKHEPIFHSQQNMNNTLIVLDTFVYVRLFCIILHCVVHKIVVFLSFYLEGWGLWEHCNLKFLCVL